MNRLWAAGGAAHAFVAVAAGAFGAHALKERLSPHLLEVFETGARYQMYHALGLLALALLSAHGVRVAWAGGLLFAGTLLFSGSLYALALTGIRGFGAVTPLGGLCLLAGWALTFVACARQGLG